MIVLAALAIPTFGQTIWSPVSIFSTYAGRVAHVETIGITYAGEEEVGGGSGILIGDQLVLTNSHVIPPDDRYKTLHIAVRLKSRLLKPLKVASVRRDETRDLALLALVQPAAGASRDACPMPVIEVADQAPVGSSVYVLGFPLNEDLGITRGLLSSQAADKGRWRTDNLITFGHSGAPAFSDRGALLGLAVAGVGKFVIGGIEQNVQGVNFIIPTTQLSESPLMKDIAAVPEGVRCWSRLTDPTEKSGTVAASTAPLVAALPTMSRSYTVAKTKDDHPVVFGPHSSVYEQRFAAEPGYLVTQCTAVASSANHADNVVCKVDAGGSSATLTFKLTSGPSIDRWRGWWGGVVTLQQRLR